MMNSQELATAIKDKIPLVVLILNDNAFGFIKWKQKSKGFIDFGLDLLNPDFVSYAESYGQVGFQVKKDDKLDKVLRNAFSINKLVVVNCPIDYSKNYEIFSEELGNMVCKI